MLFEIAILFICAIGVMPQPKVTLTGPASGIVLREQPGLLITKRKTHTQKVCVRLEPCVDIWTYFDLNTPQTTWVGTHWTREALSHALAEVTNKRCKR